MVGLGRSQQQVGKTTVSLVFFWNFVFKLGSNRFLQVLMFFSSCKLFFQRTTE